MVTKTGNVPLKLGVHYIATSILAEPIINANGISLFALFIAFYRAPGRKQGTGSSEV